MTIGSGIAVLGIWGGAAGMAFAIGAGPGIIPVAVSACIATFFVAA